MSASSKFWSVNTRIINEMLKEFKNKFSQYKPFFIWVRFSD